MHRVNAAAPSLRETVAASHSRGILLSPFDLFDTWFKEAQAVEKPWPNAINVATVDERGRPSSRMVLLQRWCSELGFGFYTNFNSRKGREIAEHPFAAMTFYWPVLSRQVRIEGAVKKASATDSDAYFNARPRGHQISAWASQQSERLDSEEAFALRIAEVEARFGGGGSEPLPPIPRPDHCGLYFVEPERVEFWMEGLDRRHERLVFERLPAGNTNGPTTAPALADLANASWTTSWLFP